MAKFFLFSLLSVSVVVSAFGGFTKSITFTTSGYQGSGPLVNFPVLVKLPGSIHGFDYADFGGTTNLVFRDSAGNAIPYEVDTWNTTGTSLVWVRVPSVTKTTVFHMYYCGSDNAANTPTPVWTAANYVGVWHMDESDGAVADATGHGLTATPAPAEGAYVSIRYAGVDAPVGHARQTGTSVKSYLSIPSYDSFTVGGTFTMSGCVRMDEIANNTSPRLFSRKDSYNSSNGWEIEMAKSDASFLVRGAARDNGSDKIRGGKFEPSLKNKWTHVALVFDGSSCSVYTNGYELVSGAVTATSDNNLPLSIGCDSDGSEANLRGSFDECRLLDDVASADWIAAEFATVASDTFVVAGAVESAQRSDGMMIFVF